MNEESRDAGQQGGEIEELLARYLELLESEQDPEVLLRENPAFAVELRRYSNLGDELRGLPLSEVEAASLARAWRRFLELLEKRSRRAFRFRVRWPRIFFLVGAVGIGLGAAAGVASRGDYTIEPFDESVHTQEEPATTAAAESGQTAAREQAGTTPTPARGAGQAPTSTPTPPNGPGRSTALGPATEPERPPSTSGPHQGLVPPESRPQADTAATPTPRTRSTPTPVPNASPAPSASPKPTSTAPAATSTPPPPTATPVGIDPVPPTPALPSATPTPRVRVQTPTCLVRTPSATSATMAAGTISTPTPSSGGCPSVTPTTTPSPTPTPTWTPTPFVAPPPGDNLPTPHHGGGRGQGPPDSNEGDP
jgi:hypothetical protein